MKKMLLLLALTSLGWAAPAFQPKVDLKRCLVGNQAGLLKVVSPQRTLMFGRGIDDRSLAKMTPQDRAALLQALNINPQQEATVANGLMKSFATLPRKEAVALLATLACGPMQPTQRLEVERFLVKTLQSDKDVQVRRQALLALAVLPTSEATTALAVVRHYEVCTNLWETFPVQQYFEHQSLQLAMLPEFGDIQRRASAVSSLYTQSVGSSLAQAQARVARDRLAGTR